MTTVAQNFTNDEASRNFGRGNTGGASVDLAHGIKVNLILFGPKPENFDVNSYVPRAAKADVGPLR